MLLYLRKRLTVSESEKFRSVLTCKTEKDFKK